MFLSLCNLNTLNTYNNFNLIKKSIIVAFYKNELVAKFFFFNLKNGFNYKI